MTKLLLLAALFAGFALAQTRVYELRTYTCNEGKLEALKARFRDHTIAIFNRHGMESIGYWVPQDAERSQEHADLHSGASQPGGRPIRTGQSSAPIRNGRRCAAESEANGKIVQKVESGVHDPTDFSQLK